MRRILLLICLLLVASTTLLLAQSDPLLGQASSYAVLATNSVSNTGTTGVTGRLGTSPGNTLTDNGTLLVSNQPLQLGTDAAILAQQDAHTAYNTLVGKTASGTLPRNMGGFLVGPGVYRFTGDASLSGILRLDGAGDVTATFIFIIPGRLTSSLPLPPAPSTGLLLQNGAQAKNIFWVVEKDVDLGGSTLFQGTILAKGNINLGMGVGLIGRALSLDGNVSLNTNNIFLPTVVINDLGVTKEAQAGDYTLGTNITYIIKAHNSGPNDATNVVVTEDFPEDALAFVSSSDQTGAFRKDSDGKYRWYIGDLKNGEEVTLTVVFKILSIGNINNRVTVIGKDPDPNPGDNEGEAPVDVPDPSYDLSVTKDVSAGPYFVGDAVTYTIVAKNAGPGVATNVFVKEQLPDGLAYVSHSATQGTFDPTTGTFLVGTLAKDGTATLTVVVRLTKPGTVSNIVVISRQDSPSDPSNPTDPNNPGDNTNPGGDTDPGNDGDTVDIPVDCPPLDIKLTGDASLCLNTQNVTYTATAVEGASYTYELPLGWTKVSQQENKIVVNTGASLQPGVLKVTVKDQCGVQAIATLTVQPIGPPAQPTISGGDAPVCANGSTYTYWASTPGDDITYEWAVTSGLEIVSGQGTATVSVKVPENSTGGTLSVKAKNSCALFGEAATKVITITPKPDAPASITGNTDVCAGTEATFIADAVADAAAYTWTVPAGWTIVSGQDTRTVVVKAGDAGGNLSVTVNNGCSNSEAAVLPVTVATKPAKPTIIGDASGCAGSTLTYSIGAVAGATEYTWAVPTGWAITSGQHTPTIIVQTGSTAGDVSVVVTNKCGDGEAAALAVKGITAPATPGSITGNSTVCLGSNEDLIYTFANAETGATYTWTLPTGWTLVSGQGTAKVTVRAAGTAGGNITVTGANSCGTSNASTIAVTITAPPAAAGPIKDNSNVCDGLVYSIDAVPGATSYTWTVSSGFTITAGQGTTSIKVTASSPTAKGQVTVVANTGSCASPQTSAAMDAALADGQLNFPKAFSPNGDRINDTWEVANLLKFPNNEVIIFNRWGSEVYRQKNYKNDWNGNKLEQGTYFYKVSVQLCNGVQKEFTGYVTIFR
ncbi:ice-binding family protein [Pontibacter chitinilyticus]|uniref:ice-binding family protein n=1 Tax=Pontibacter chitinilyticus TaxID=2674989 RepID=UPI003219CF6C